MRSKKTKKKKIRLLLVDDHPVVRDGIKFSLSAKPHIQIVGEASDGEEAVRKTIQLKPDVVLMDINMPSMSGLEAAKQLRTLAPDAKILALTMHDNKEYILRITQLGAKGYVFKDDSPSDLIGAIEAVYAGDVFFSPKASKFLLKEYVKTAQSLEISPIPDLTLQECEVLKLIASELTTKKIAEQLNVSPRTVETYRERIMEKLNISTVAGLTKFAIQKGLIELK